MGAKCVVLSGTFFGYPLREEDGGTILNSAFAHTLPRRSLGSAVKNCTKRLVYSYSYEYEY